MRRAALPQHLEPISDRLRGWWYGRVIQQLMGLAPDPILGEELDAKIDDLRDQFDTDNLPIDVLDDSDLADLTEEDRVFVRQLQLVAANDRLIELAIRDYKRAYVQRSRWSDDGLLLPGELGRYERTLIDEWEHHQAVVKQRYEGRGSEVEMQEAGMELFLAMHDKAFWIRPRVRQPFVVRGSFHGLANEMRVGWHPDFIARLRSLLEQTA